MTTQPATRQGDAPPRHLLVAWRRTSATRQAAEATRQAVTPQARDAAAMNELSAATDAIKAAAKRRQRKGDSDAIRYVTALLKNLATDIDRRRP